MSSIRSTIRNNVSARRFRKYGPYAEDAITALEQREQRGVQKILDFAQDKGANMDEVRDFLSSLGVDVPAPAPSHSDPVIAGLLDFARSKGYAG